jgi:hypothetical protein
VNPSNHIETPLKTPIPNIRSISPQTIQALEENTPIPTPNLSISSSSSSSSSILSSFGSHSRFIATEEKPETPTTPTDLNPNNEQPAENPPKKTNKLFPRSWIVSFRTFRSCLIQNYIGIRSRIDADVSHPVRGADDCEGKNGRIRRREEQSDASTKGEGQRQRGGSCGSF